jgi:IS5 family transposase
MADIWTSRAGLDSASGPGERGAETGQNPTNRGKRATKRHLVVDREGTPLGVRLSPANRHDSLMLAPTLDAVPGARSGRSRPGRRPDKLHADSAHDHRRCRKECRARSIQPRIARRGVDTSQRDGTGGW